MENEVVGTVGLLAWLLASMCGQDAAVSPGSALRASIDALADDPPRSLGAGLSASDREALGMALWSARFMALEQACHDYWRANHAKLTVSQSSELTAFVEAVFDYCDVRLYDEMITTSVFGGARLDVPRPAFAGETAGNRGGPRTEWPLAALAEAAGDALLHDLQRRAGHFSPH